MKITKTTKPQNNKQIKEYKKHALIEIIKFVTKQNAICGGITLQF